MFKFIKVTICFAVLTYYCNAQVETPTDKKYNHYIGFQANELLKQLFNFSSTSTAVTNPYLFVYSISQTKTGWGLHAGIGLNYKKTVDTETPVGRESKTNNFFYRVGIERRFMLGKKFEAGVALDFIGSNQIEKTSSINVVNTGSTIDSSISVVDDKITSWGGGPQASLGYHITDRIILSTEVTMYYSAQKQKQNITVTDISTELFNNNLQTTSVSNSNTGTDTYGFSFTIPVSLFLVVKF